MDGLGLDKIHFGSQWQPLSAVTLAVTLVLIGRGVLSRRRRNPAGLPLPPGPPKLPVLGNLIQLAGAQPPWETYTEWAKEYGEICVPLSYNG
jgi:hypothetical protein